MTPRITLLTDFGTRDGFVGAVKGVLASLAANALVDDVAHDLPAGDVRAGARALDRYWARYPAGTVHLVVVDPGVGTDRRALACAAAGRLLVGPDNGVLTPALRSTPPARCVAIDPARLGRGTISPTFHARDLFAPAAAALAVGRSIETLGDAVDDPVLLRDPAPIPVAGEWVGEVVAVDRFGSLATNLPGSWSAPDRAVEVAGRRVAISRTYGDVAPGEVLALVDSEGRIEIAARDGSAARLLGVAEGAPVRLIKR